MQFDKIIKYLCIGLFVLLSGIYLLFFKSCDWYLWMDSDKERREKINDIVYVLDEIDIPETNMLITERYIRRAYSYGYKRIYKTDDNIDKTLEYFHNYFKKNHYEVKSSNNSKKIRATKNGYAFIVAEYNIDEEFANKKFYYEIYAKPDDIFGWKNIELDSWYF